MRRRIRTLPTRGIQREAQRARPAVHGLAQPDASIDCGWGRLIFAHTFETPEAVAEALRAEGPDRRDIALYARDPQVVLTAAPQELFLDPSHTYRLDLPTYRPAARRQRGFSVRRLSTRHDAEALNTIHAARGMVPIPPDFFWSRRDARALTVLVAEDDQTGEIVGSVMGVDHVRAFGDAEGGCSLWCLAVSPQAPHPGIGEALVRRLAEQFQARGLSFMDLSVLHDNTEAIRLYEKLGLTRVTVFALKRKNPINEKLFAGPADDEGLNPYAQLIVNEARRRGIFVQVIDGEGGLFRLTSGGTSIRCRESLSELTTAVALSICDDKRVTRRFVKRAGIRVPRQCDADDRKACARLLDEAGSVVVKPARGEQGHGVAVGLKDLGEVESAVEGARVLCPDVLVEECVDGEDMRLVVIDYKVVAVALRRPAHVVGDGESSVRALIEAQSRRRMAATGGESSIPLDAETQRCLASLDVDYDTVPERGVPLVVRKTANLHTGGTIHDVTAATHPALIDAATKVARAIDIPVVGVDLLVRSPTEPDYVFIEANERPGLANHQPQPTAERFVDLLFPLSRPQVAREAAHAISA